jgi:hypothetical protein
MQPRGLAWEAGQGGGRRLQPERKMDQEDANGVLTEWITILAEAISNGIVEVGGDLSMEATSGGGHDYAVEVTSAWAAPGLAELVGRIRESDANSSVLEARAEMEIAGADAPGA